MAQKKKKGWFSCLMDYASGSRGRLAVSTCLSVVSVLAGLLPYFCIYRIIEHFISGTVTMYLIFTWSGLALAAYMVKILFFGLSTGLSHYAAYHILEGLRLRVADRLLHAPLGEAAAHSIGEIKNIMVYKCRNLLGI